MCQCLAGIGVSLHQLNYNINRQHKLAKSIANVKLRKAMFGIDDEETGDEDT